MKWYLMFYVLGHLAMTAGPIDSRAGCEYLLKVRSAELDESFAKLPKNTGFVSNGAMVVRKDVSLDCQEHSRRPELRTEPRGRVGLGGAWRP